MADHIQINDVVPRVQYTADGVQTVFDYPFAVFRPEDLEVYVGAGLQEGGYTVTGAGATDGGTVAFASAPPPGDLVTLRRRLDLERTTDFQDGGAFRATVINTELDRLTAMVQQVAEQVGRSIQRPAFSSSTAGLFLPPPAVRRALVWSPDGDGFVNTAYDPDALVPQAQASADAAATSASEAATSASEAASSAGAAALSENNALTYRIEAEQYANSIGQADVVRVTADTTLGVSNNGNLIAVDATAGPVTVTLPSVAAVGEPYTVKIKKVDGFANTVTVAPSGTDTIDTAAAAKIFSLGGAGATFSADLDTVPDDWATAAFGASSKLARTQYLFTLTAGQTTLTGVDDSGRALAYSGVGLEVYYNGRRLPPSDYTATDGSSITLAVAATAGDEAHIVATGSFDLADTYTSAEIDTKLRAMFPVGAIYINADGTNPGAVIGGTWVRIGEGRTLVGVGTGTDGNGGQRTFAAGEEGGEYTHTLTAAEMPSHSHHLDDLTYTSIAQAGTNRTIVYPSDDYGDVGNTDPAGDDQPHNNVPPYLTVFFWQRTA